MSFYNRMGIGDCIADSTESYAEIAVRIARDCEFRDELRSRIGERSDVLFDDASVVGEYEQRFLQWIEESRRK
jgi:predicted O-linked N-acetylglucosamine transferase (SPINDLY family)